MKIKLVSADGADRHLPTLSDVIPDGGLWRHGETHDVPDEIAGAAPYWRRPVEGDELHFMETRSDPAGQVRSVHDLGHGLLAQVDVFERDDAPAPKDAE